MTPWLSSRQSGLFNLNDTVPVPPIKHDLKIAHFQRLLTIQIVHRTLIYWIFQDYCKRKVSFHHATRIVLIMVAVGLIQCQAVRVIIVQPRSFGMHNLMHSETNVSAQIVVRVQEKSEWPFQRYQTCGGGSHKCFTLVYSSQEDL